MMLDMEKNVKTCAASTGVGRNWEKAGCEGAEKHPHFLYYSKKVCFSNFLGVKLFEFLKKRIGFYISGLTSCIGFAGCYLRLSTKRMLCYVMLYNACLCLLCLLLPENKQSTIFKDYVIKQGFLHNKGVE